MLKNHCQPCGDQGVLCHATSPHGLIPPIKRSRVPGLAERVAVVMVRLLPKNSVFPIYSELHHTLSSGSKKWPMFAKIGRLLFWLTSLLAVATNFNRTINLYGC